MSKTVRAAGGVVVLTIDSQPFVLVTHRPHYDDWSIPKGKRDNGESDRDCALREVLEETGLHAVLHDELPQAEYTDHKGRPKIVRYWHMTLDSAHHSTAAVPPFQPNDEVDEVRWLSPTDALALLQYEHDQALVSHLFPDAAN
jgi:8-oxo-dGTP diphosphatase